MKKILIALGFTLAAVSAQAATLSLAVTGPVLFTTVAETGFVFGAHDVVVGALGGTFGQLSALNDTTFAVTFLGKEADRTNFFVSNGTSVVGSANNTLGLVGQTFFFDVAAGVIDFGFRGPEVTALNTGLNNQRIAYITNDGTYIDANTGNPYSFLIGFNDGDTIDGDYDDYVVGVSSVSEVPVPAALPLMASALGLFGLSRRKNKVAAV